VLLTPSTCFLQAQPYTILAEVMSKILYIAFPHQALEEVDRHFTEISGIPVVDDEHRCVGVLSRKDRSKVSDVSA
jgi:CBS domain-containing protein